MDMPDPTGKPRARAKGVRQPVATGLDRLAAGDGPSFEDVPVSVLCHAASVSGALEHVTGVLSRLGARITSVLGPEHGVSASAQDMAPVTEKSGGATPTYSLYGEDFSSLSPTPDMFHGAQWLVCDLQDVGSRYYTYVWSIVLAAEAALAAGLQVLVLDRPNPLGGLDDWVEGRSIAEGHESFVGLHPVCTRHGMTVAELVSLAVIERAKVDFVGVELLPCGGWRRDMAFSQTLLPWVLPSPNMPTLDTATVYPGQCLLEGTNLSEGRGHTRPFETFGAPWIEGAALVRAIAPEHAPGLALRPVTFRPTFHKFADTDCGGLQLHVRDAAAVRSVRTTWAVLREVWRSSGGAMKWRTEPYEFVNDRPAIDVLAGGPWLREAIEAGTAVDELIAASEDERQAFLKRRRPFLMYE